MIMTHPPRIIGLLIRTEVAPIAAELRPESAESNVFHRDRVAPRAVGARCCKGLVEIVVEEAVGEHVGFQKPRPLEVDASHPDCPVFGERGDHGCLLPVVTTGRVYDQDRGTGIKTRREFAIVSQQVLPRPG